MSISSGLDDRLGLDVVTLSLYLYQPQVISSSHHLQSNYLKSSTIGKATTYSHRPTVNRHRVDYGYCWCLADWTQILQYTDLKSITIFHL